VFTQILLAVFAFFRDSIPEAPLEEKCFVMSSVGTMRIGMGTAAEAG
jgi:hypothetical protein